MGSMTLLLTILMAFFLFFFILSYVCFLVFLPLISVINKINKPHPYQFLVYKGSLKYVKIDLLCLFRNIERPGLIRSLFPFFRARTTSEYHAVVRIQLPSFD